jgi:hypothetical protein
MIFVLSDRARQHISDLRHGTACRFRKDHIEPVTSELDDEDHVRTAVTLRWEVMALGTAQYFLRRGIIPAAL